MDARTGATEAFQLSDVSVQMVAEGMLLVDDNASAAAAAAAKGNSSKKSKTSTTSTRGRYCPTKHAIMVDGKETTELDTVLCLVNTALLSHNGLYSAVTTTTKKKTGRLTKKALKSLAKALHQSNNGNQDDSSLLALLCDFATLVALYEMLDDVEISRALVTAVRQYTRGHKRTTTLDATVKQRLQSLLLLDK